MRCIKRLKIHGFKKFNDFEMLFNENLNILIGDNESGKSTLLDTIDLVLRQKYRNYDKYIVQELLNQGDINAFLSSPSVDNLPHIDISIELQLENIPDNALFYGMNHSFDEKDGFYGIRFTCEIPEEFKVDGNVMEIIKDGHMPYEYYQMSWNTFQGESYKLVKKPLSFMIIDCDNADAMSSYNYYCRTLFSVSHDMAKQSEIKNNFRSGVHELFCNLNINEIGDTQKFGINDKKMIFENIVTVLDDDIPVENKGKGKESLIKTKIAIDKAGILDTLAIEEPETHLSFLNLRRMLEEIRSANNRQLLVTTHESMITSGLGVQNVLWIKDEHAESLNSISQEDADFFLKAPNNNLLQFILSNKVILVEGPTEFMLIPVIFKKICGKSIDEAGINIISCGGISYERFLSIAEAVKKKVAIVTDNDMQQRNLEKAQSINNERIHLFMDKSLNNWTWEVCFYNLNKKKLEEEIEVQSNAEYLFNKKDYGPTLGKMLNNKVDIAYQMLQNGGENFEYEIPGYIEEACKWINA